MCLYLGGHGYDGTNANHAYDEILEFRADTEDWSLAGRMLEARSRHAVSTINFGDVYPYCDYN